MCSAPAPLARPLRDHPAAPPPTRLGSSGCLRGSGPDASGGPGAPSSRAREGSSATSGFPQRPMGRVRHRLAVPTRLYPRTGAETSPEPPRRPRPGRPRTPPWTTSGRPPPPVRPSPPTVVSSAGADVSPVEVPRRMEGEVPMRTPAEAGPEWSEGPRGRPGVGPPSPQGNPHTGRARGHTPRASGVPAEGGRGSCRGGSRVGQERRRPRVGVVAL